jgi:hypothetical protein
VGASILASTPKFGGFVQKSISSRASKSLSIFEAPPNLPSKPPLLEALYSTLQNVIPPFLLFFILLFTFSSLDDKTGPHQNRGPS